MRCNYWIWCEINPDSQSPSNRKTMMTISRRPPAKPPKRSQKPWGFNGQRNHAVTQRPLRHYSVSIYFVNKNYNEYCFRSFREQTCTEMNAFLIFLIKGFYPALIKRSNLVSCIFCRLRADYSWQIAPHLLWQKLTWRIRRASHYFSHFSPINRGDS